MLLISGAFQIIEGDTRKFDPARVFLGPVAVAAPVEPNRIICQDVVEDQQAGDHYRIVFSLPGLAEIKVAPFSHLGVVGLEAALDDERLALSVEEDPFIGNLDVPKNLLVGLDDRSNLLDRSVPQG